MEMAAAMIPSSDDLRKSLIARVNAFCALTGITKSEVGKQAVNDVAFVSELEGGRNITMRSYEKLRVYLDKNWPKGAKPTGSRRGTS